MSLYEIKYAWSQDVFSGSTSREVVKKMKEKSPFTRFQSVRQYIKGYALRHRIYPGEPPRISTRTTTSFLRSLAESVTVEYVILNGKKVEVEKGTQW